MWTLWLVLCFSVISYNGYGVNGRRKTGIHRPCSVKNLDCIRNYFADNFNCTASRGPVPDPYIGTTTEMHIPHANITIIKSNGFKKSGLSKGEIKELYINRTSGYLVFAVEFEKLFIDDPSAVFRFYRAERQPIELRDSFSKVDMYVSITLVVPFEDELEISESTVYTYIRGPLEPYKLGPGLLSKDLVLNSSLVALTSTRTTGQEAYNREGPVYLSVYFENNIYPAIRKALRMVFRKIRTTVMEAYKTVGPLSTYRGTSKPTYVRLIIKKTKHIESK